MKFKGYGVVWNPKKKRALVNFKHTPEYETNDSDEIEILSKCKAVTSKSGAIEIKEAIVTEMTKKEVMESLEAFGIEYNPRDKKEVLLALLEG